MVKDCALVWRKSVNGWFAALVLPLGFSAVLLGGIGIATQATAAVTSASQADPSPTPCAKPQVQQTDSFSVNPKSIDSGDAVTIQATVGGVYDLCQDRVETHNFRLQAGESGTEDFHDINVRDVETTNGQGYRYESVVNRDTSFRMFIDGRQAASDGNDRVLVNRRDGQCVGDLVLSAPSAVAFGQSITVTGSVQSRGDVGIFFHRRGEQGFSQRRTLTPDASGNLRFTFVANDDYRVYASNERCDSASALILSLPTVNGPRSVQRNAEVVVAVRGTPGNAIALSFRRRGQTSFTVRRRAIFDEYGEYRTSYIADDDYRYQAFEQVDQRSSIALTQTY